MNKDIVKVVDNIEDTTTILQRKNNSHNKIFTFRNLALNNNVEARLFYYAINLVDVTIRSKIIVLFQAIEKQEKMIKEVFEESNKRLVEAVDSIKIKRNDDGIEKCRSTIKSCEIRIEELIKGAKREYLIPKEIIFDIAGLSDYKTFRDRSRRLSVAENNLMSLNIDAKGTGIIRDRIAIFGRFTLYDDYRYRIVFFEDILPYIYKTYKKFTQNDIDIIKHLTLDEISLYLIGCQFRKQKSGNLKLIEAYDAFNFNASKSKGFAKYNQRVLHQNIKKNDHLYKYLKEKDDEDMTDTDIKTLKLIENNKRVPLQDIFNYRSFIPFNISIEPVKVMNKVESITFDISSKTKTKTNNDTQSTLDFGDIPIKKQDLAALLKKELSLNTSTIKQILDYGLEYKDLKPLIDITKKADYEGEINDTSADRRAMHFRGVLKNTYPDLRSILK